MYGFGTKLGAALLRVVCSDVAHVLMRNMFDMCILPPPQSQQGVYADFDTHVTSLCLYTHT